MLAVSIKNARQHLAKRQRKKDIIQLRGSLEQGSNLLRPVTGYAAGNGSDIEL